MCDYFKVYFENDFQVLESFKSNSLEYEKDPQIIIKNLYENGFRKFYFTGRANKIKILDLSFCFEKIHLKFDDSVHPFPVNSLETNCEILLETTSKCVEINRKVIEKFMHINRISFKVEKLNFDFAEFLIEKGIVFQSMINVPKYSLEDGKYLVYGRRQAKKKFFKVKGYIKYVDTKWILDNDKLRRIRKEEYSKISYIQI